MSKWINGNFQGLLGIATLSALVNISCFSAVTADEQVGKVWPSSQLVSMDTISHDQFDNLLKKYVDEDGFVNYTSWHNSSQDRKALQDYLVSLSQAKVSARTPRSIQLAFWINAYNAVTLEGILKVYPTSSIRNHTAKVAGYNIWDDLYLPVGGKKYSLNNIEHDLLRKMKEPRIHFAIVCASIGCPRLLNEAYTAEKLENQLVTNTTDFFSRSQNLQSERRRGTLEISSLIDWFGNDFGSNQTARLRYLRKYFPARAQNLVNNPRLKVSYLKYNWELNDQKSKP